ncbi:hypothetical protein AeMF1_021804 [Aphanomyces euteiches]|nr:hypothetical protein AeMF1_021804 [Aphanomyces euteiches]
MYEVLSSQLSSFFIAKRAPDHIFNEMPATKPDLLWSEVDGYDTLSDVLIRLHRNPTGAAGGERNHKTGKLVHSKSRVKLSSSNIEMQVAVAFNSSQLVREIPFKRTEAFVWHMLNQFGIDLDFLNSAQVIAFDESGVARDDDDGDDDDAFDFDDLESVIRVQYEQSFPTVEDVEEEKE